MYVNCSNSMRMITQYERTFSQDQEIFPQFYEQLQQFLLREDPDLPEALRLNLNLRQLYPVRNLYRPFVSYMKDFFSEGQGTRKEYYTSFIDNLRLFLNLQQKISLEESEDELTQRCCLSTEKLCLWIYSKVDLNGANQLFCRRLQLIDFNFYLPDLHYASLFRGIFNDISNNKLDFNDAQSEDRNLQDGHRLGQLAYRAFTLASSKTEVIYTGQILKTNKNRNRIVNTVVVDEFISYLKALKREEKTHLQVVLMSRQHRLETRLVQEIEALENHMSVKKTFFVVTLDKNSRFYRQEGDFDCLEMDYNLFKRAFLQQLFEQLPTSHFKWPAGTDLEEWKEECSLIIDQVQKDYSFKQFLTKEERKVLIDIVYLKIVDGLCVKYRINFCSVTCQYLADRTAALMSSMYFHDIFKNATDLTEEQARIAIALQFCPALVNYNRPPSTSFTERNFVVIDYLQKQAQAISSSSSY